MGRRRTIPPDKLRMLRQWKPFRQLCKELGIKHGTAKNARHYAYKTTYEGTDIHSAKNADR